LQEKAEEPFDSEKFAKHPAWWRLNEQLDWYDRKSSENQRRYKQIKVAQLILASSIPVFALVGATWGRWITAILGASVAILEGFQQLGQYNTLWVTYRATAEQLKHEKYLFLARSGPYQGLEEQEALRHLAERVEERVSTEHAKWVSEHSQRADKRERQGEKQ
jgi:hypothetical protein